MLVLISYDVNTKDGAGRRRLRRIAKTCLDYGQRVQYSVFECGIDPTQWTRLRHTLMSEIDEEKDSLRFYFLGSNWKRRVEHIGTKQIRDLDEPLII